MPPLFVSPLNNNRNDKKIKGNRGRATMDEKDYELLHALDETRNITHAADKLYMTQSALSKRIKAL